MNKKDKLKYLSAKTANICEFLENNVKLLGINYIAEYASKYEQLLKQIAADIDEYGDNMLKEMELMEAFLNENDKTKH